MIRIALADDHEIVRTGFKMLIEQDPEMAVVGEAADGMQAYEVVGKEKPDVLLMDISMPPGQSGLRIDHAGHRARRARSHRG